MPYSTTLQEQGARTDRTVHTTAMGRTLMWFALAIAVSSLGAYFGLTAGISLFMHSPPIMFAVFLLELILVFTARWWSTHRPINYIAFALFAFITGIAIVPALLMAALKGGIALIIRALLATAVTFIFAGIVAWKTEINMLKFSSLLFFALIGMLVVGVLSIFIPFGSTGEMIYSFFGVVIFAVYTIYDLQRLRYKIYANEVEIALNLYLDIFNLFLYILRFLSSRRN